MADGKGYFVAMTEFHFMNAQTMSETACYPDVQRWWSLAAFTQVAQVETSLR